MKNSFGNAISLTLFGESHGPFIGAVLDGLAPGMTVDESFIRKMLELRRPYGRLSTSRVEADEYVLASGVFNGKTTGTPLTILIPNKEQQSRDYEDNRFLPRPSHADYTAFIKYHGFEDYRGGGHFSGRIIAALTAAGGILIPALKKKGIRIATHIHTLGEIKDQAFLEDSALLEQQMDLLDDRVFAVLSEDAAEQMMAKIEEAASGQDSIGGTLETIVTGLPAGIGEPWFDTLEGVLSKTLFSIPSIKGVEFGEAFLQTSDYGSVFNDAFRMNPEGRVITETNHNAGINGGISNGMPVIFKTAVKPTPSISRPQKTVDLKTGENALLEISSRHDPAIIQRARAVQDSVTALVTADLVTVRFGTDWLMDPEHPLKVPVTEEVFDENIILAGMSGAGKTTVGNALSVLTGKLLIDTDTEIEKRAGKPIRQIFEEVGESGFRELETAVIRELMDREGCIISTGGGAVLREENVLALKKRGRIFFLERDIKDTEPSAARPLADTPEKIRNLYVSRYPLYRRVADEVIRLSGTPEEAAREILEKRRSRR